MKRIVIILVAILSSSILYGQTNEWINQHNTQTNYQLKQIGLLKLYSSYVSKGCGIVKTGLATIHNIKEGDLSLHSGYFSSLGKVSPVVKRYSRIADILTIELSIMKRIDKSIHTFTNDSSFSLAELNYIRQVFENLKNACGIAVNELYQIITDAKLQMKDDERLIAIDRIYQAAQEEELFSVSFCNTTMTLSLHRKNEKNDILISKKLNAIQ